MKAVVAAFNQEKALVGAFSVLTNLRMELFQALVKENVRKKGEFFESLFSLCVDYKVAALDRGERTPLMDRLIFKNVRALVGGRLRVIFSGGAPLSQESHQFLRACLGCPVLQVRTRVEHRNGFSPSNTILKI